VRVHSERRRRVRGDRRGRVPTVPVAAAHDLAERDLAVERRRLVHEHVGLPVHEPLVLRHPQAPTRAAGIVRALDRAVAVRHRIGRIAYVTVGVVPVGRAPRTKGRLPPAARVRCRHRLARRPGVEPPPALRTRVEDDRFRELALPLVLQPVGEARRLDLAPVVVTRRAAPRNDAARVARVREPLAVLPGPDHEEVDPGCVGRFHRGAGVRRAPNVLLVPPAADGQSRNRGPRQVKRHRT
jgi:hypothetical protein